MCRRYSITSAMIDYKLVDLYAAVLPSPNVSTNLRWKNSEFKTINQQRPVGNNPKALEKDNHPSKLKQSGTVSQ